MRLITIGMMGIVAVTLLERPLVADDGVIGEPAATGETGPADPADPKLAAAFALINKSPDLLGWDQPNPVALVRAVNHLHGLEKDEAIATLRAYVRYAPVGDVLKMQNSPSQQRLCWIIPLLFVTTDDVRLPSLGRDPKRWSRDGWEQLMISVEGELPFHDAAIGGRFGTPDPSRDYLVEWAALHGQLRKETLRPAEDPLGAADKLCDRLLDSAGATIGAGYKSLLKSHVRLQARRTIEHLFAAEEKNKWEDTHLSNRDWRMLKEAAGKLEIRWDAEKQDYVTP